MLEITERPRAMYVLFSRDPWFICVGVFAEAGRGHGSSEVHGESFNCVGVGVEERRAVAERYPTTPPSTDYSPRKGIIDA